MASRSRNMIKRAPYYGWHRGDDRTLDDSFVSDGVAPSRIGRKDNGKIASERVRYAQTRRIRISERCTNVQTDMLGAPVIVEADVEQVRGEAEVICDPCSIKTIRQWHFSVESAEKLFCIAIANSAERSLVTIADQLRK